MSVCWGIPVPLLPGELFSTWLVRAAIKQGCDPLVLTSDIWPRWRTWTIDIDRCITLDRINILASVSGVAQDEIINATLGPTIKEIIPDNKKAYSIFPWILALGSRNRKRNGGLQFCPKCIANDKQPYFRQQWRLAWHTSCSKHLCYLYDRCPQCNFPIEPHRLLSADRHVAICANCKLDFRLVASSAPDLAALRFQNITDEVVSRQEGYYGQERLGSSDWFFLARFFISLIRKAARGKQLFIKKIMMELGVDIYSLKTPATGLQLELLSVYERAQLLSATEIIMSAGPERFLHFIMGTSASIKSLREPDQKLPQFMERIFPPIPQNINKKKRNKRKITDKPRSYQAVLRMWARIKRKSMVPN
jgi:hypothetical protein